MQGKAILPFGSGITPADGAVLYSSAYGFYRYMIYSI